MARICILIFASALLSCSQVKPKKSEKPKAHLSATEIQKLNEQASARVSGQLKELAIAAKASGKEKVRFLASDMFLKASAAQMEGDYRTANIVFEQLVELVPEDGFIQKKYAIGLIRAGELPKAQKILEKLHKSQGNADIALVLAGVYTSLGQTKLAQNVYQGLLKKDPSHEDACVFLSKTQMLEKKFTAAVKTLKQCEARSKGKGIFSYYIGKMYVDQGELAKAKSHFKRAAKLEPDFSQAIMALGLVHEEQGKKTKAIEIYKKYLGQKPNDTLILSRLVQLMFSVQKFQEATPFAERLSDLDPDNLNLKVKLGILYTDAKKYSKAITTFKELLAHAPENDKILYYLGAIYQELNQFENSVDYFSQVPASSGLYQDSSLQAAQMLSSLALDERDQHGEEGLLHKKFVDTVTLKAKEIPEMEVEFQVIKAGYFESLEYNQEAIEAMESVVAKESFTDNHRYYLASLYEKEGEYEKVLPLIEQVLKKNPEDAYAHNFLGYTLLEKGEKLAEAYKYIAKAVELNPNDGYIRDSLGWYYYKTGDVERALSELQKAVSLVPDDVSIQKHLAIVYGKLRQYGKAKEYIRNAIGLAKFEYEKKELMEVLKNLDPERIPASSLDE